MARQKAKAPSQRTLRVGELVRHALTEILMRDHIRSAILESASLTVTGVDVTPDLRQATVYVMPLGGDQTAEVLAELNRHAGAFRGELGRRITLKFTPALTFQIDPSFDEADRIESLLRQPRVARDLAADDADPETEDAGNTEEAERG